MYKARLWQGRIFLHTFLFQYSQVCSFVNNCNISFLIQACWFKHTGTMVGLCCYFHHLFIRMGHQDGLGIATIELTQSMFEEIFDFLTQKKLLHNMHRQLIDETVMVIIFIARHHFYFWKCQHIYSDYRHDLNPPSWYLELDKSWEVTFTKLRWL